MRRLGIVISALAFAPLGAATADEQQPMSEGKKFFYQQVLPKLAENGCPMCHARDYVRPNVTIYEELMPYLGMGDSPEKTVILYKIANLRSFAPDRPTHPGGQRCKSLEAEPCKTIKQWWSVEFGNKN